MWYHFQWSANYKGQPVHVDQYVACGLEEPKHEGFPGAVPAYQLRSQQPKTVAVGLSDGSRLFVRIPDMCLYNRAYRWPDQSKRSTDAANRDLGRQPGWKSRGPFKVTPMVMWADRYSDPTQVEFYIGDAYYRDAAARLRSAKTEVEFMPLGFRPPDAETVLKADSPLPIGFDASRPKWISLALAPAANPAHMKPGEFNYPPHLDTKSSTPNFDVFTNDGHQLSSDDQPFAAGPLFAGDLRECLSNVLVGTPGQRTFPLDNADFGSEWPDRVRRRGDELHTRENLARLARDEKRLNDCYAALDTVRSLVVDGDALSAAKSPPGALIFTRWNDLVYATDAAMRDNIRNHRFVGLPFRVRMLGQSAPFRYRLDDRLVTIKPSGNTYVLLAVWQPYQLGLYDDDGGRQFVR